MKVALFTTCLGDQFYPQVGQSVLRVLRRLGCDVEVPSTAVCCGQPAWNSGYAGEARAAALRLLETFGSADYVVSPSGSCCGMIRHYYEELFEDEPALQRQARSVAERSFEFSQFVVSILGVTALDGSFPHRVTYHPSCHGARLLGARAEPLTLLRAIPKLELVPLGHADDCCGFGGTFSIKLSNISVAIADEKVAHVEATGADYLVSTDLGCLMNIAGRMRERGVAVEALHLAQLVERALDGAAGVR